MVNRFIHRDYKGEPCIPCTEVDDNGVVMADRFTFQYPDTLLSFVASLGIDWSDKHIVVNRPKDYCAWPFIRCVGQRIVCVYSCGKSHWDNNTSLCAKISYNGIIWSNAIKIKELSGIRNTATGCGLDNDGNMLFWNRVGQPGQNQTYFELYKTDGSKFNKISTVSQILDGFSIAHIGDIISIQNIGLVCFFNTYSDLSAWGMLTSTDNGITWQVSYVERNLQKLSCPHEISPAYVGNGKIIAFGRSESVGGAMFQLQSSDYGTTWETLLTNIIDTNFSTPSIIYNTSNDSLSLFYTQRGNGSSVLWKRKANVYDVWDRSTNWGEHQRITDMINQNDADAGNVNVATFDDNIIASYYMGTSTNTGIYVSLIE